MTDDRSMAEIISTTMDALGPRIASLPTRAEQQAEAERAARRDAIARSGAAIMPEDEKLLCGKHTETTALVHVKGWWKHGKKRMLVLCGGVGVGKTVAACWPIVDAKLGVVVSALDLAERISPQRGEEGQRLYLQGRYVVLDDLGAESYKHDSRLAERFTRALFTFVDMRKRYGRTIITSNLSPADFRGRYGDRVCDRLNHVAAVVRIKGPSLRKQDGGL